jgi:hypothetical protein
MSRGFVPPKFPQPAPSQFVRPPPRKDLRHKAIFVSTALLAGIAGTIAYFILVPSEPPLTVSQANVPVTSNPAGAKATSRIAPTRPPSPRTTASRPTTISATADIEIREAVTKFLNAINDNDGNAVDRMLDAPRSLEEMRSLGVLTGFSDSEYARFSKKWERGYGATLCRDPHLHLRKVEIRRIEVLPDSNEVRVYTHAWNDGSECTSRWWLRKTGAAWRIYDFQHLHNLFLRESRMSAFVVGRVSGNVPDWCFNKNTFQTLQVAVSPDDSSMEMIALLQRSHFPPEYESVILAIKAMFFLKTDPGESIRYFDDAITKYPDNPPVYCLRASAFLVVNRFQEGLESMIQYIDLVGDSALACAQLGFAYEGLHRSTDAANAFRRGLACDPSSKWNQQGLARVSQKILPAPRPPSAFDLLR